MSSHIKGFTIVELLIVIVVIGILAAITIVAYNGVTKRSQETKIASDTAQIKKAIFAARITTGKTLNGVTGSYATAGTCVIKASGTDLAALAKSDGCWVNYTQTMSYISAASGLNISQLVDPWGRPYLIDENEGEGGLCNKDSIVAFSYPFSGGYSFYPTTPANNMPTANC